MLNWIVDKYDAFMIDDWPFLRWVVYAYLAFIVLIFVESGGINATAGRLNCELAHLTHDATSPWRWADCAGLNWFPRR
jgi:hypothetical protein